MIAAVDAVLASTHVPAATLAVRHGPAVLRPVAGSTMWCTAWPRRRHRRAAVPEVAIPPPAIATVWPGASSAASWRSVTRTRHPPAGGGPATAMSPPKLTSTPEPASGGRSRRGPVRAPRLGRGPQINGDPGRDTHGPRGPVDHDHLPAGNSAHADTQGWAAGGNLGEVTVVAQDANRRADGRVDEAMSEPGGPHCDVQGVEQHRGRRDGGAPGGVEPRQLRVVPESAARGIDRGDLRFHRSHRSVEVTVDIRDQDHRGGAQRREGDRGAQRGHDAPERTWEATGLAVGTEPVANAAVAALDAPAVVEDVLVVVCDA